MFNFNKSSIVKKNPIVIVKNFIFLQLTAVAVFFLSGVLLDYGEIYEHLPLPTSLSFHIAEAMGIFFIETIIVFYIFFRWHKEYYNIKNDKVIYSRGILFRRRSVMPLKDVQSVSYKQGPLGRLVKYGTLELQDKHSGKEFILDHIPEPKDYADFIISIKNSLNLNQSDGKYIDLEEIISKGENERLEFKASLRWDFHQSKVNKNLERMAMKTIVAFLNSDGGQLLIGVSDSGDVVGLGHDYRSLPKPNSDGFQNHFTNIFHAMIGPEFRQFVELKFINSNGGEECCFINVLPSKKPAYLINDKNEEFFIRTGNGTTSLRLSEVSSYIESKWRGTLL